MYDPGNVETRVYALVPRTRKATVTETRIKVKITERENVQKRVEIDEFLSGDFCVVMTVSVSEFVWTWHF